MHASEFQAVLREMDSALLEGRPFALATIISVRGSTYRRPGARLFVSPDRPSVGNLSGGCLEGDVEAVARDLIASGGTKLLSYDLTADDEAVWGWGLGCNGAIDIFLEAGGDGARSLRDMAGSIQREVPVAIATIVQSSDPHVSPGSRTIVAGTSIRGGSGDAELDASISALLRASIQDGSMSVHQLSTSEGPVSVFIEALLPPPRLVVCGAGHDAIPVVELGARLGWSVIVIDDRGALLAPDRFPGSSGFVHCEPSQAGAAVGDPARTYVVIMSHNFLRDRDYLGSFLATDVPYIAALGPRSRLAKLVRSLEEEGTGPLLSDALERVNGPAGLDLGAEGPDEVAFAIIAEVLAAHHGRTGAPLKARRGPIHDPLPERTEIHGEERILE